MNIEARDCLPLTPRPTPDQVAWLRSLVDSTQTTRLVLPFGDRRLDDEPVVYCERDGTWYAGRYVGVVQHLGSRLTIQPRFGLATLAAWLGHAVDAIPVESPGRLREDVPFVVQLLAMVWGRAFADAARHGLPALRRDRRHVGTAIRGRLDVRGTINELMAGREVAVSLSREKSLNNPAGRVLAAAYRVLRRCMGPSSEKTWIPERVAELLPSLLAAVGPNCTPPAEGELSRVRYTPITLGFARAVYVSRLVLRLRGLMSEVDIAGDTQGVLFDVAELWELFVLAAVRRAAVGMEILHGTSQAGGRESLVTSDVDGAIMGELRPDVVIRLHRRVVGILDAKYKSLWPTARALYGPQREDMYQLAAYLSRFAAGWGMLAYPKDPDRVGSPMAEARNPWRLEGGQKVTFITLSHDLDGATRTFRSLLTP